MPLIAIGEDELDPVIEHKVANATKLVLLDAVMTWVITGVMNMANDVLLSTNSASVPMIVNNTLALDAGIPELNIDPDIWAEAQQSCLQHYASGSIVQRPNGLTYFYIAPHENPRLIVPVKFRAKLLFVTTVGGTWRREGLIYILNYLVLNSGS